MLLFLAAPPGQDQQIPDIKVAQAMPQAIGGLGEAVQGPHLAIATHVIEEGNHAPATKGAITPTLQKMLAGWAALQLCQTN